MIVCLCRGVSEATLQALIQAGAHSARNLAEVCGVGIDCGACCALVEERLELARIGAVLSTADAADVPASAAA